MVHQTSKHVISLLQASSLGKKKKSLKGEVLWYKFDLRGPLQFRTLGIVLSGTYTIVSHSQLTEMLSNSFHKV